MNKIKIIDKHGKMLEEFDTGYEYEIGEIININSGSYCKCKEVVNGLKSNIYIFVKGWIEYGF